MQSERPRAVGLPSGPGPRSRARSAGPGGRSRREASSRPERDNERDTQSSARNARGQRPVAERSRRSEDSSTSSSTSGSSLFDRMKTGAASYASSFTSVEDEEDKSYTEERGRSQRNRNRYQAQGRSGTNQRDQSPEEETEAAPSTAAEGYGGAFWTRVATAASGLTVSVSKAWATNVATYAGEETPPGQESRLTRAMKAYHLEKARDPSDLPPWLFEEHERRPGRVVVKEKENREKQPIEKPIPKSSAPRGLRDIYDSAAVSSKPGAINQTNSGSGDVRTVKKTGTDRLRALREARMPNGASATPEPTSVGSSVGPSARAVPQRVGLPGGPGRGRRV